MPKVIKSNMGIMCGIFLSFFLLACVSVRPIAKNSAKSPLESQPLIVGGLEFSSLPAVGALRWGSKRCSATLITSERVLTAAHCVFGMSSPEELQFLIGPDATRPVRSYGVKKIWIHPHYNRELYLNDLAVLELKTKIDPTLSPIPIGSEQSEGWAEKRIFVIGYGYSDGVGKKGSGKKRALWLTRTHLKEDKFMSLSAEGKSTCGGDSGGPALIQGKKDEPEWSIVGVSVFGQDTTCSKDSIFMRIEAFRQFILMPENFAELPEVQDNRVQICKRLKEQKRSISCSEDGLSFSTQGRFLLVCDINPWQVRLTKNDCSEKIEVYPTWPHSQVDMSRFADIESPRCYTDGLCHSGN